MGNLKTIVAGLCLGVTAIGLTATQTAQAGTIYIEAFDSGWYDQSGYHSSTNTNYYVGTYTYATSCGFFGCNYNTIRYRNFFTFNTNLNGRVATSGTLQLQNYNSGSGQTYTTRSVGTNINTLTAGGTGLTGIYNDLGSGTVYSSGTMASLPYTGIQTFNLTPAAINAINANSQLAFGGTLSSGTAFGSSYYDGPQRLVLNTLDPVRNVSGGNFGNVRVGTTGATTLTVTNTGAAGTTLQGYFYGAGGEFGSSGATYYGPLGQNQSASRNYSYTPTARGGPDTTSVYVSSVVGGPYTTLTGTGVGPVFDSTFGTSGTIDFGEIQAGTMTTLDFDIFNLTPDPGGDSLTGLTILNASFFGPDAGLFSLLGFTPGTVISKGGTLGLDLKYSPLTWGNFNASLILETDQNAAFGGSGQTFTFDLQGTAISNLQNTALSVPEPATLALFGFGLAGLGFARRRKTAG